MNKQHMPTGKEREHDSKKQEGGVGGGIDGGVGRQGGNFLLHTYVQKANTASNLKK